MKNRRGDGRSISYTNAGADIKSGDVVVMGNTVGVAFVDIATGETGEVAIEGEFNLPKVATAVIGAGEMVIWDVSEGAFEDSSATPAAGDVSDAAIATVAAGATETVVSVKLLPPGTKT